MNKILTSIIVATSAGFLGAAAQADLVTGNITADNHYALFTSLSSVFNYHGGNGCFLQADQTNATTTFANINNCSFSVTSGRRNQFRGVFFLSDSTAADGAKIDFNGGAATATNFRVHCAAFDTVLALSTQVTALSCSIAATTLAGSGMFECYGTFEPSSSNTFIPRFAQNAHTTGTLTLARGSHLQMMDVGP